MRALLAFILCAMCSVLAGPAQAQPHESAGPLEPLDWVLIPNLKFNDDAGFVYGGKVELIRPSTSPDRPFDWELRMKLSHSTRDRHEHRFNLDLPDALGTGVRAVILAEFVMINDARFFGVGNETRLRAPALTRFGLIQPRASVHGRSRSDSGLFLGAGVGGEFSRFEAPAGSLLAGSEVTGAGGSHAITGLLTAGFDSRDDELAPHRGVWLEFYLRGAAEALGSSETFGGVGLSAAGYLPLTGWAVFAQRVVVDRLVGEVPLAQLGRLGGSRHVRGLGGVHTQRGFTEARFIGETKFLSNTELRLGPAPFTRNFSIGGGPFLDVSRVFAPGDAHHLFEAYHPSVGAEVTLGWKETFLMRLDYGISAEGGRFYIQSRHLF